jgi:methionine synthase I (cobalamin-dependent)
MSRFLDALHSGRVLLMDGAMGTELQRAGIGKNECYELWNLSHPEQVRAIHESYVRVGAECLVTNSFQANPVALLRHGVEDKLEEIAAAAVRLARLAASDRCFVLASIGPFENSDEYALGRVVTALQDADGILLETWPSQRIILQADLLQSNKWNPRGLPILLSFAFERSLHPGYSAALPKNAAGRRGWPAMVLATLAKRNVSGLGVNCGRDMGVSEIADVLRSYRSATDLPLFARPNAGTPRRVGETWEYPLAPEQLAAALPKLLRIGATMVGGCCGTTPAHIAALRHALDAGGARTPETL